MKKFLIEDETLAYVTAEADTNTDPRHLVAGSQNTIIDQQKKVRTRNGTSRLGAANATITPNRGGVTWNTSTGDELMLRAYDDELEVYLGTVDGTAVNAFKRVTSGLPTTGRPRFTTWYDDAEGIDLLIFVVGDDNMYEWGGGVAIVSSITATTITKAGTSTFAQNRFYATGDKVLVNIRTGTEYTYTGGESTTTLTGISDTTGIIAGDILVQKIVTQTDTPASGRNNHTVWTNDNQVMVASDDDEQVYVSKISAYDDFAYSSPRVPGEGALLTLDNPAHGFGELEDKVIIFAGRSSVYQMAPKEITIGSTLTEALDIKKYQTGVGQAAVNQEVIVQVNNTLVYLSHEPAVREILSPRELEGGGSPRTLSNPIKPDIEAETWTNPCAAWYKSAYYLSCPTSGRLFILEYREDADGKLRRFWQPPQTGLFVASFCTLDNGLYGHSASVPETYRLFDPDTYSDINSEDEKIAIHAVARFAYRNFEDRAAQKTFDEYFVEGEISPSTTIRQTLRYGYGGNIQQIESSLSGSDFSIIEETIESVSLAQQSLGTTPLGGALSAPEGSAKFRAFIELAPEDLFEIQDTYESEDVDKYWAIISRGPNARVSGRRAINRHI